MIFSKVFQYRAFIHQSFFMMSGLYSTPKADVIHEDVGVPQRYARSQLLLASNREVHGHYTEIYSQVENYVSSALEIL